jgi:hypothetical protein
MHSSVPMYTQAWRVYVTYLTHGNSSTLMCSSAYSSVLEYARVCVTYLTRGTLMYSCVPFCTPMYSSAEIYVTYLTLEYSYVLSCTPMYSSAESTRHISDTGVPLCTLMHSYVLSCTPMYSHALLCTLMHSYVLSCTPMYSHALNRRDILHISETWVLS